MGKNYSNLFFSANLLISETFTANFKNYEIEVAEKLSTAFANIK